MCDLRVESRMSAVAAKAAPFPIPAHRTGRADLPHPALRQNSPAGPRTGGSGCPQTRNAQRTKDLLIRQQAGSASMHLASPPQKMPDAIRDMMIDRLVGPRPGPVAEVVRPASQETVQPVSHLQPRSHVARYQNVVYLLPHPRHTLLRRTGPQVPTAILPIAVRPKRVSEKVKTLRAGFLELGLRLVQGQPQACHHLPVQSRASAACRRVRITKS